MIPANTVRHPKITARAIQMLWIHANVSVTIFLKGSDCSICFANVGTQRSDHNYFMQAHKKHDVDLIEGGISVVDIPKRHHVVEWEWIVPCTMNNKRPIFQIICHFALCIL